MLAGACAAPRRATTSDLPGATGDARAERDADLDAVAERADSTPRDAGAPTAHSAADASPTDASAATFFDERQWMAARGLVGAAPQGVCEARERAPASPVEILVCRRTENVRDGRVRERLIVWKVSGNTLTQALSATVGAGPASPERNRARYFVKLDASLAEDNATVFLKENPDASCANGHAHVAAVAAATVREYAQGDARLVQEVCSAIGRYVLRGGVFVRAR
jgi:hypothetical protein